MTTQGRRSRIGAAVRGALPARLGRENRRSRGAAELSVLVVTGSLVAGVFFGQGLSQTAVDVADGLTWLSDDPSGEIVQVNPATGDLEARRLVGKAGDDLEITDQFGQQLYVTDHTTGQLMALDLTSLLVSGQRRVGTGGAVDTLQTDDGVFLIDTDESTIAAMDPVTTDLIGTIWVAPGGLADAVVDGDGTIWALEDDGAPHQLRWSAEQRAFDDEEGDPVAGSGPGSVLVGHEKGVTVFGPDQGVVAQVGTDHERTADAPKVLGDLAAPESAPSDLVPVSASDSGFLIVLTDDGLIEVDMRTVDCGEPGGPEVFSGLIYVPCHGDSKVVRLDGSGRRAGSDIETPGAENPELVLDDDNLIINTPGADRGVVVHDDGSTTSVVRRDDDVPLVTPTSTPPPPPPPDLVADLLDDDPSDGPSDDSGPPRDPGPPGTGPPGTGPPGTGPPGTDPPGRCPDVLPDGGRGGRDGLVLDDCEPEESPDPPDPTDPSDPSDPTDEPEVDPLAAPTSVSARTAGEGLVEVSWVHESLPEPDGFVVRWGDGQELDGLGAGVRQVMVDVAPGASATFTVTAVLGAEEATSAPTAAVTATGRPGAPSVSTSASYPSTSPVLRYSVVVNWGEAPGNGAPVTGYDVSVTTPDGVKTATTGGGARSATLEWECSRTANPDCSVGGGAITADVTASNSHGPGPAARATGTGPAPPPPPPPLPVAGQQHVTASSGGASVEGFGQTSIAIAPPASWQSFAGPCYYDYNGGGAQQFDCATRSLEFQINSGYIYEPNSGETYHSIVFSAANERGTARSAPYSWTTDQPVLCDRCQPP